MVLSLSILVQQRLVDAVQVSGDMMTVIDLEEYKQRKKDEESQREMKKLIQKLDSIADYAYENYDRTKLKGYENFKKLLKTLDEKYEKSEESKTRSPTKTKT